MPHQKELSPPMMACHRLFRAVICTSDMHRGEMRPTEKVSESFRLLDLPIEIRLMIYEKLKVVHTYVEVPLIERANEYPGLITNTTLEGVAILATSRQVNEEAGRFLNPQLARMLRARPTIIVRARRMISLTSGRSMFFRNILQAIVDIVSDRMGMRVARGFHRGKSEMWAVRFNLRLYSDWSDEAVKALVLFLIRIEKRISSKGVGLAANEYPSIALVISKPAAFTTYTMYYNTTIVSRLFYRIVLSRTRPRQMSITMPFGHLTEELAFRAARLHRSSMMRKVAISIMLYLPDTPDYDMATLAEWFKAAVETGIRDASPRQQGIVGYGGLWGGLEI